MTQTDFSGRTVLVTGAASGIGAASATLLSTRGAQTAVLIDRDAEGLTRAEPGCETITLAGDIADPAFWAGIEGHLPAIDHAVLNAGIAAGAPIADMAFDEWRDVLRVNLDGAFLSLKAVLPKMRDGGSVVLTASVSGIKAEPGTAAYGCSKAGVIQLARVAAKECAPRRIRVNAIVPGGVDTAIWDQTPFFNDLVREHGGDRDAAMAAMGKIATPLGRYATAEEVAGQIAFLLSDAAAMITGAVLVADGGYSL